MIEDELYSNVRWYTWPIYTGMSYLCLWPIGWSLFITLNICVLIGFFLFMLTIGIDYLYKINKLLNEFRNEAKDKRRYS